MTPTSVATAALQTAFVVAAALTWVAVVVLAVGLRRTAQGRPVRDLPADLAGQAALLFAGTCLVTATAARGLAGTLSDVLLYAAAFGGAAATLTWAAEAPAASDRPGVARTLKTLALAAPIAAGVLAGVVGTP